MHPTARRLAAGSLAAIAMLAAGPLATAGAKGGVPKLPRPVNPQVPQVPQVPQAPQAPQAPRIKTIVPLSACGNASKAKFSYEQNALGAVSTAEISNTTPGIPVLVVVNGAQIGSMTTDAAGTARQVFPGALTLPITSVQLVGPGGVLDATVC